MSDASFHDGREAPLNLGALEAEDLQVISTLVQDAVFPIHEMSWRSKERRFALLLHAVGCGCCGLRAGSRGAAGSRERCRAARPFTQRGTAPARRRSGLHLTSGELGPSVRAERELGRHPLEWFVG